jgi:biotin carboxyl carrier protein
VEAEVSGTVAEILCEEGQAVNEGEPLARLS